MLSPILPYANTKQLTHTFKFNYRNYCSPSFTSDLNRENLDKAANPRYFNLPQIKLPNGQMRQLTPDKTQVECAQNLLDGNSVVYVAPTGTGKTADAHFAVNNNLDNGKRTLIPVPMIALANDKYDEFKKIYGENNVGILTGDRKINPKAPIVIMTTEILYNQMQDFNAKSDEIGTIVFDEAHYISNEQRGNVWENTILNSSKNNIQTLCLSATIGNSDKLAGWISSLNPSNKVSKVELKPSERYVPLVWKLYRRDDEDNKFASIIKSNIKFDPNNLTDKQKRGLAILFNKRENKDEFYIPTDEEIKKVAVEMHNYYDEFDSQKFADILADQFLYGFYEDEAEEITNLLLDYNSRQVKHIYEEHKNYADYTKLIKDLDKEDMLPALIFRLSRADSDNFVSKLKEDEVDLTNKKEKEQIKQIIDKYKETSYLGKDLDEQMLLAGYASHHAGHLPAYRKLIEELFSKKLLKAVSATSTLSVGINMPARTVVISDMQYRKYDAETDTIKSKLLTVNEFHQMAGRAGRRGVDKIGYVVLFNLKNAPKVKDSDQIDELETAYNYIASNADDLRSVYRPDPCLVANYYAKNSDNSSLLTNINESFKVYLAQDKDKCADALYRKFDNFSKVLLKQGFIYKDYKGNIILTPKGKLLASAQGANPLVLSSLIYDKGFENMSLEQVCQIAGYIAGSDEQSEPFEMTNLITQKLSKNIKDKDIEEILTSDFLEARKKYKVKEDKIIKSLKESKVKPDDILISDNFSGYASFLWAYLNQIEPDTIKNFETITEDKFDLIENADSEEKIEKNNLIKNYNRKANPGNVYRVLTHTVSVLKQIVRICQVALEDSDNYPDVEYYEKLMNKAKLGIEYLNLPPINTEEAY